MKFFPVVERELRVASRKRATYWARVGAAVAALGIGTWVMMFAQLNAPQTMGKSLFVTLSVVMMIYTVQNGLRSTVDCLSEEKREGTLGLLFLTDLKGVDVVFGKLTANSIGSVYGLLASLPILAISILLGGVSGTELLLVSLAILNILLLSLSVGMFGSAVCRDERRSLALSAVIALIIVAATPLLGLAIAAKRSSSFLIEPFLIPSPAFACVMAFDSPMRGVAKGGSDSFWISMLISHLYSWLFLALACVIVPRSWQDKSAGPRQIGLREAIVNLTQGSLEDRNQFRTRLLETNPFYWLAARDRFKARLVWILLGLLAATWVGGLSYFGKDWLNPATYVLTALTLHAIFKFWLTAETSRRFVEDRRSGAMEWLLCTPISVEQVLRGQRLGLLYQFGAPAAIVVVIDLLLMLAGYFGRDINREKVWLVVWLVGIAIFVMDLFALSWLAMWTAMTAKKTNRASGAALTRILLLPWVVFGFSLSIVVLLTISPVFQTIFKNFDPPPSLFPLYWFGLSVANNLFWIAWARRRLQERFRDIATQRFEAPTKRFGWFSSSKPTPPVIAN